MVWVRSPVYFYKRNETFYVSRAIPSDFLHRFNKRKIDVSLRTKSELKAAKSVAALRQGHLKNHRSLFSLHQEAFTVLARPDLNIKSLADLRGKRVNIGLPGTAPRATLDQFLAETKLGADFFGQKNNTRPDRQSQDLCSNGSDALVFTVGHPSGQIKNATSRCGALLIGISDKILGPFLDSHKEYIAVTIPGGTYRGSNAPVNTFGVVSTLVTTADMPEHIVYKMVKSVFSNFDEFRSLHPALAPLTKDQMIRTGLTAPLHPGALKYYREAGLMK